MIGHWLDEKMKFQSRHVQIIQMEGRSGSVIASKLQLLLQQHKVEDKIVACVTDEGINLKLMRRSSFCNSRHFSSVQCLLLGLYHAKIAEKGLESQVL